MNFKVWKEVLVIVFGCMDLDLTLRVEKLILTLDNLQRVQSVDVFKSFKAEVELQLGKKIKAVKSDRSGKYYGRYDRSGEQRPGPLFETGNARILEEVEFGKEKNIRNVVFEEESVNDIGQVLVPITVQETTLVIGDNVQTIVPDIVPEQDYDEVLPQTPRVTSTISRSSIKEIHQREETCNSKRLHCLSPRT
ncbi:hypothetical protein CR513_59104, partial [Mucuna pruriens]